jgi:hypothetical protein
MFKDVMNDLWLARISSLSIEVGLYVILLEMLLFMALSYLEVAYVFNNINVFIYQYLYWLKRSSASLLLQAREHINIPGPRSPSDEKWDRNYI